MCKVICTRVGMHEDFYYADGENVDRVMEEAVEHLTALDITIEGRDKI